MLWHLSDDNFYDTDLFQMALNVANLPIHIDTSKNGRECIAMLYDLTQPDLILLDLNMPVMDGRQCLAHIRRDPYLMHLPVIIWTGTASEIDVLRMYQLGCAAYILKPVGLEGLVSSIQTIYHWFHSFIIAPNKKD